MLAGLLAPSTIGVQLGQSGSLGIMKMLNAMKGQHREKMLGVLAGSPMVSAGNNIAEFQGQMGADRDRANQFASQVLDHRLGSLGGIENAMAATRAAQGVGNKWSGQGAPKPGDWIEGPDGGRLVWTPQGMWARQ